jgi:hypothetical protein
VTGERGGQKQLRVAGENTLDWVSAAFEVYYTLARHIDWQRRFDDRHKEPVSVRRL